MAAFDELIEVSGERTIRAALTLILAVIAVFGLWAVDWNIVLNFDFIGLWRFRVALLNGLLTTLGLTVAAALFGILFGTLLAIASQLPIAPVRWMVIAYVELFRNTPIIVQLIWIHFALPLLTGISTPAVISGLIAIVLQASAYFSEIVRGGIQSIPRGYWDASDALGIPIRTRWTHVILPPAFRLMIPPLANMTISFLKASSILSVLQIGELMTVATRISNTTFRPVEILTVIAVIYFVFGFLISQSTHQLETAFARRGDR